MKRSIQRFLSAFLVTITLLSFGTSALAMDNSLVVLNEQGEIVSRMEYLTAVYADMEFDGNKAGCSGAFIIFTDNRVKMTVQLQKSKDGKTGWTAVQSWTETFSSGGDVLYKVSTKALTSGYYYRVKATASPLSDTGRLLETASTYSEGVQYTAS